MQIDKLRADDYGKGIIELESQFKDNYMVLNVINKRTWALRNFGKKYVEIFYTKKEEREKEARAKEKEKKKQEKVQEQAKLVETDLSVYEKIDDMEQLLASLVKEIRYYSNKSDTGGGLVKYVEKILIKNGIDDNVAKEISKTVSNSLKGDQKENKTQVIFKLADILNSVIRVSNGIDFDKNKRIAFVGPTGVGKTTTLAKIAAILYEQKRDIGIITLDTFRTGAVAQLQEYANIIHVPVEVCSNVDELQRSLIKFMKKDNILIDTTGRSQKSSDIEFELKEFIDIINPDRLELVLSATSRNDVLDECIKGYGKLDFNSIIFTKMDEANVYGSVINTLFKNPALKVDYFTTGQNVPDDIEIPRADNLIADIVQIKDENEEI